MTFAMRVYKEFAAEYKLGGECPICHQKVTGIVLRKNKIYLVHRSGTPKECHYITLTPLANNP